MAGKKSKREYARRAIFAVQVSVQGGIIYETTAQTIRLAAAARIRFAPSTPGTRIIFSKIAKGGGEKWHAVTEHKSRSGTGARCSL